MVLNPLLVLQRILPVIHYCKGFQKRTHQVTILLLSAAILTKVLLVLIAHGILLAPMIAPIIHAVIQDVGGIALGEVFRIVTVLPHPLPHP